jgi:hypothetical protein
MKLDIGIWRAKPSTSEIRPSETNARVPVGEQHGDREEHRRPDPTTRRKMRFRLKRENAIGHAADQEDLDRLGESQDREDHRRGAKVTEQPAHACRGAAPPRWPRAARA